MREEEGGRNLLGAGGRLRVGGCLCCVHRRTSVSEAALAAGTGPQGQVGPPFQPAWPVCGWGGLAQPGLQVCQVWGLGPMSAPRALGLGHLAWLLLGHFSGAPCPSSPGWMRACSPLLG